MDKALHDRLVRWQNHIQAMESAEREYLSLEAQEKSFYSALFLKATGKNVAEKEAIVYSSEDWRTFKAGLVEATVTFNRMKRELAVKQSAFQADYLQSKNDTDAMMRLPKDMT